MFAIANQTRNTFRIKALGDLLLNQNLATALSTLKPGKTEGKTKPTASQVLTSYILQCNEPPWTSYFVKYSSIVDDQWGKSHFNWPVGNSNYHILRTGCYPYIKYHCSKRQQENLEVQDKFFRFIKVFNLGIPCLAYGVAASCLITHEETVHTPQGAVKIYFLYAEDKGSEY